MHRFFALSIRRACVYAYRARLSLSTISVNILDSLHLDSYVGLREETDSPDIISTD